MRKITLLFAMLFCFASYGQSEKLISVDKDRSTVLYDYLQTIDKKIANLEAKVKTLENKVYILENSKDSTIVVEPDPIDPIDSVVVSPNNKIYGYGKNTVGGTGGRIIEVTNLNDSGSGSLREAVEATGKRIVKFAVNGRINLKTSLHITNPFITIDGSDANITLSMEGYPNKFVIRISTPEVILKFLTVRRSLTDVSSRNSDGIYIEKGNNIVLQNLSLSWASDELLAIADYTTDRDTKGTYNITVQDCLFGYTYGDKGILISGGATNISLIRPVFASTKTRTPAISTPTSQDYSYDSYFEVINPIFYDTSTGFTYQINKPRNEGEGSFFLNLINGKSFQNEGGGISRRMMTVKVDSKVYMYLKGNESVKRPNALEGDEYDVTQFLNGQGNIDNALPDIFKLSQAVNTPALEQGMKIYKANELVEKILPFSGNYLPQRDAEDIRTINDIINLTQSYSRDNVFPYD